MPRGVHRNDEETLDWRKSLVQILEVSAGGAGGGGGEGGKDGKEASGCKKESWKERVRVLLQKAQDTCPASDVWRQLDALSEAVSGSKICALKARVYMLLYPGRQLPALWQKFQPLAVDSRSEEEPGALAQHQPVDFKQSDQKAAAIEVSGVLKYQVGKARPKRKLKRSSSEDGAECNVEKELDACEKVKEQADQKKGEELAAQILKQLGNLQQQASAENTAKRRRQKDAKAKTPTRTPTKEKLQSSENVDQMELGLVFDEENVYDCISKKVKREPLECHHALEHQFLHETGGHVPQAEKLQATPLNAEQLDPDLNTCGEGPVCGIPSVTVKIDPTRSTAPPVKVERQDHTSDDIRNDTRICSVSIVKDESKQAGSQDLSTNSWPDELNCELAFREEEHGAVGREDHPGCADSDELKKQLRRARRVKQLHDARDARINQKAAVSERNKFKLAPSVKDEESVETLDSTDSTEVSERLRQDYKEQQFDVHSYMPVVKSEDKEFARVSSDSAGCNTVATDVSATVAPSGVAQREPNENYSAQSAMMKEDHIERFCEKFWKAVLGLSAPGAERRFQMLRDAASSGRTISGDCRPFTLSLKQAEHIILATRQRIRIIEPDERKLVSAEGACLTATSSASSIKSDGAAVDSRVVAVVSAPSGGVAPSSLSSFRGDELPHRAMSAPRSCLAGFSLDGSSALHEQAPQAVLASPCRQFGGLAVRSCLSSKPNDNVKSGAPFRRRSVHFAGDIDVDGRLVCESLRAPLSVPKPMREEVAIHPWKKLGPIAWYQHPGTLASCDDCEKTVSVAEGSLHGGKHGAFTIFTRPMFSCHACLLARGYTEEMLNHLIPGLVQCRSCSKCNSPLMDGKVRWWTDGQQGRRPCCQYCLHGGNS